MMRARAAVFLLAVFSGAGCAAHDLDRLDKNVGALQRECDPIAQQGGDLASCRQRFEQDAVAALAAARQQSADPALSVAFYRVAAVASFEAGPLGAQTVVQSTDEGTQTCQRLPQQDASAPRDCALIRLALPLAVAADLSRKVGDLAAQRDALRRTNPSAQLPASDFAAVRNLYDGLETQLDKLSAIRAGLNDPVAPEALTAYADQQRRAVYCWALKAYSLAFDVAAAPPDALTELTARKTALRNKTEQSLGVIDCRSAGAIAVPPQ